MPVKEGVEGSLIATRSTVPACEQLEYALWHPLGFGGAEKIINDTDDYRYHYDYE